MRRSTLLFALFGSIFLVSALFSLASAQVLQRQVPAKADIPSLQTMAPTGRIIIKFHDDSGLVVRQDGLAGDSVTELTRVRAMLADKSRGIPLERRFDQSFEALASLRQTGQAKAHGVLPNLNAYGVLDYSSRTTDREELIALLKNLLADPAVETAFLEPRAVPAALGFDAFTGTFTAPEVDPADHPTTTTDSRDTPDYSNYQGYLLAPPNGVNALAANGMAGARGADMKMVDIELGWNFDHEDLPSAFFTAGNINSTLDNRNHGTAVLGEIRGSDNGFGVRGITPDAQVGASSAYNGAVSNAIMNGWDALDPGDVLLIELHAPGPAANGEGQFGYVPMEYWQDNFDAIMTVTANGAVVCEAAGNGTQNLDDPIYGPIFDRTWRDSGAIMCGAATIGGYPFSWSNNGTRVDLNGWGSNVGTCGYGDLQGSPDFPEEQFYTAYFSGTSSASPIVTGSVIALQGMAKASYDFILDALTIRTIMAETGTPQGTGGIVGPRPDILAAFQNLEWGLGEISGTVTDASSGLPIEGVEVSVAGTNQSVLTDATGSYQFITDVGLQDLVFTHFFYHESTGSREIIFDNPATLDMTMTLLPAVDIRAIVRTESGVPLTAGRLTAMNTPLIAETLPGGDGFLIAGAPIGIPLELKIDNEPFHGVDVVALTPTASPTGYNVVYPELATADHDFELWWYNYTASNGHWVWGTPTDSPSPFSGEKCWGVGMDGNYPDGINDLLSSDSFNLSGNEETYLSLHYWSDLEDGVDGVNLQILSYNSTWVDIEPIGGYSHESVSSLSFKPGWSGNSGGWQGAVFDIQEYTDLMVKYRFKFYSDSNVRGAGFFIDDVTFDTGNSVSPVELAGDTPSPRRAGLSIHPNPFNPQTTIQWEVTRPGQVKVRVFDARGLLVKDLVDEFSNETRGSVVWDGRNNQGRAAASGTYLVQVKGSTGQTSTKRVTLIK